jgi:hypothetical protein
MEPFEEFWKGVQAARPVPILGEEVTEIPTAFEIDRESLFEYFRLGFGNFEGIWRPILEEQDMHVLRTLVRSEGGEAFCLPIESWVRIVYRYAAAYQVTPRQRMKMVDTMIPLYYARVASLINELRDKNPQESEMHFDENARVFEQMKGYLLSIWKKGA